MAEVVVLISSLMFTDLQNNSAETATARNFLREMTNFNAKANYALAIPAPERPDTVYLSIMVDEQASQFVEAIRGLDGVYSVYVKPASELPQ